MDEETKLRAPLLSFSDIFYEYLTAPSTVNTVVRDGVQSNLSERPLDGSEGQNLVEKGGRCAACPLHPQIKKRGNMCDGGQRQDTSI